MTLSTAWVFRKLTLIPTDLKDHWLVAFIFIITPNILFYREMNLCEGKSCFSWKPLSTSQDSVFNLSLSNFVAFIHLRKIQSWPSLLTTSYIWLDFHFSNSSSLAFANSSFVKNVLMVFSVPYVSFIPIKFMECFIIQLPHMKPMLIFTCWFTSST